ncbi:hypothetical protein [Bremerella cremea]|uniref:hypothetical protein n=1 Tax=Bremerella cremea TaxID=1031537 RepID=UPI001314C5BD|nr:hypothetical protein [Bremerella cremea]
MIIYGGAAGATQTPPTSWPTASIISRDTTKPTLLVFLHPECPCTRATLDNLEPMITDFSVSTFVIYPGNFQLSQPAQNSDLGSCRRELLRWQTLPNVTLVSDNENQEAERFRALTSGYCLLFDTAGKLRFSGGVTVSRGHHGANSGLASLRSILSEQGLTDATYPVFGCPLQQIPCDPPPSDITNRQTMLLDDREGHFHA